MRKMEKKWTMRKTDLEKHVIQEIRENIKKQTEEPLKQRDFYYL